MVPSEPLRCFCLSPSLADGRSVFQAPFPAGILQNSHFSRFSESLELQPSLAVKPHSGQNIPWQFNSSELFVKSWRHRCVVPIHVPVGKAGSEELGWQAAGRAPATSKAELSNFLGNEVKFFGCCNLGNIALWKKK